MQSEVVKLGTQDKVVNLGTLVNEPNFDLERLQMAMTSSYDQFSMVQSICNDSELFREYLTNILEQHTKFHNIAHESINQSLDMASHTVEFVDFLECCIDGPLMNDDILEALNGFLESAQENERSATNLYSKCQDIVENLTGINKGLSNLRYTIAQDERQVDLQKANKLTRIENSRDFSIANCKDSAKFAALTFATAMITAPLTGGVP